MSSNTHFFPHALQPHGTVFLDVLVSHGQEEVVWATHSQLRVQINKHKKKIVLAINIYPKTVEHFHHAALHCFVEYPI